ncbi:MAG: zinc ribbon domain-containing protein [Candidatus Bathyarchaeota archaeon]|nr:zinc ribbon domain-containing protein [Candidatus Bathyarchaeota archaeon]
MVSCQYCGTEVRSDDQYCPHCGSNLSQRVTAPLPQPRERRIRESQEKACFGPAGSGGGLWGALSGAIFLIGIGVIWYFDFWWPGILFLIALMAIIGGIVSYTRR